MKDNSINFKELEIKSRVLGKKIYYANYLFFFSAFLFYLTLIHLCFNIVDKINIFLLKGKISFI